MTVIVYVAGATLPTVKWLAVNVPEAVTVHAEAVATVAGVMVQVPASATAKLLPFTVIIVPAGPEVGVRVMLGPITVNDA